MVEAGESKYSWALKRRKLLILRNAKNAVHGKIAANWNVSGTRIFNPLTKLVRKISLLRQARESDPDMLAIGDNKSASLLRQFGPMWDVNAK
jgi:hypothetical protein